MGARSDNTLVRRIERVVNSSDDPLLVWLEPSGEEYSLARGESLDLVFVAPSCGVPEISPGADGVTVYGWEGSRGVALLNGRLAAAQPTVAEIVRQEFEIGSERVRLTGKRVNAGLVEEIQRALDAMVEPNEESQENACKFAALLLEELANSVHPSKEGAELLWEVADRVVGTRGALLSAVSSSLAKKHLWPTAGESSVVDFVFDHAYSVLPGRFRLSEPASERRSQRGSASPKQRRGEHGSGPLRG